MANRAVQALVSGLHESHLKRVVTVALSNRLMVPLCWLRRLESADSPRKQSRLFLFIFGLACAYSFHLLFSACALIFGSNTPRFTFALYVHRYLALALEHIVERLLRRIIGNLTDGIMVKRLL